MNIQNKLSRLASAAFLILLTLTALPVCAQSLIFEKELGAFQNAGGFSLSNLNAIYVTDLGSNEVYKLDFDGKVKNFIGGYGWSNDNFDMPVDVCANTIYVYVTDKNNNRIQLFDKDLNYLSTFKSGETDEYTFAYPLSAKISPLGDLFILDSDNSRIIKYNLTGDFLQVIGDYQSGSYTLDSPQKFAIGPSGKLYVISGGSVVVFDSFGAGMYQKEVVPNPVNINITGTRLCVNNTTTIAALTLGKDDKFTVFEPDTKGENIVEAAIIKDKLYVLTVGTIMVYKIVD